MKTLHITALAISLSFASMSFSTSENHGKTSEIPFENGVVWKAETIDVGNIPQGVPFVVKFEFTNTMNQLAIISNVKVDCGCTATEYSKEPIKPNNSGFINAVFDAAAPGAFSKTVTVWIAGSNEPNVLTFKGTVIPKTK